VRGPIWRTELLCPQSGQRLHLVATSEERELFWIGRADVCETFGQQIERIVPRNWIKNSLATLGAGAAKHRVLQLCFRILLHDARATFSAQHALIHQVIAVALNEAHMRLAVTLLGCDIDAATAGAHVAGGVVHRLAAAVFEHDCTTARRRVGALTSGGERDSGRADGSGQNGGQT